MYPECFDRNHQGDALTSVYPQTIFGGITSLVSACNICLTYLYVLQFRLNFVYLWTGTN